MYKYCPKTRRHLCDLNSAKIHKIHKKRKNYVLKRSQNTNGEKRSKLLRVEFSPFFTPIFEFRECKVSKQAPPIPRFCQDLGAL